MKQYGFVILNALLILWYFVGPYEKTRIIYKESPKLTILLGVIFFGLLAYFLSELIKRKAEITLTKNGIELRDKGFFEWNMIESFSTRYYRYSDSHNRDLVLHLKEGTNVKLDISILEKNKEEIVDLIIQYRGDSFCPFFEGHLTY